MERYFSNTSSAYLHELHVLQERLIAVNDLSSALKVDDHLAAILSHNPSRLTRSACLRWRTSFVETLEAKITSKPTSLTPFELQKIEQLLDNSSSPAHDRIPSAWCLTMVPDVKVSRSASLRIIKLVDELKEKATELEQKEAADAALSLAFRRIRRNVLDQETERFTKRAYEGWHGVLHDKQSYKDCVPLIHAGTMYSMNLARLGKLDQAERLVDSIKVPPNSVHAREELNGFVQARLEIAQMRSRQGRDDLVKLQFEKLRTLLAAQMLISQSDRDWLLRLWKKEEEKL